MGPKQHWAKVVVKESVPGSTAIRSQLQNFVYDQLTFTVVGTFVGWIITSTILYFVTGKRNWAEGFKGFKACLSVYGYSLIPTLILQIMGLLLIAPLVPGLVLDTSLPREALERKIVDWYGSFRYGPIIPLAIVSTIISVFLVAWLFGVGTQRGTKGKSGETGFYAALLLGIVGSIGVLIGLYS